MGLFYLIGYAVVGLAIVIGFICAVFITAALLLGKLLIEILTALALYADKKWREHHG